MLIHDDDHDHNDNDEQAVYLVWHSPKECLYTCHDQCDFLHVKTLKMKDAGINSDHFLRNWLSWI